MTRKLTTSLERDTGLKLRQRDVSVTLKPSHRKDPVQGGWLIFTCKGKEKKIPLSQILINIMSDLPSTQGLIRSDWVHLADLESQVMIQAPDVMEVSSKASLYRIIRRMRDERRKEKGLPPVVWSLKKEKKIRKIMKRSEVKVEARAILRKKILIRRR